MFVLYVSHGGQDRTDPSAFREPFRLCLKETRHNRPYNFHRHQNIFLQFPCLPDRFHPAKPSPELAQY